MVNLYDGGSNTETSPHYVPKTDKAISLVITGQDDLFPMYQVAVIKRTSDSGALVIRVHSVVFNSASKNLTAK